jgi:pimeloyl-ACP methyl ester carboxylesterase
VDRTTDGAVGPDGFELRLIRVWTQPESTLITPYKMIDSLLYLPEGSGPDVPRPGVLFVHGWSRYPYDEVPRALGPRLASHGVAVLSLAMRRRGGEGQIAALPDDDLVDIATGLDALGHFGVNEVVLVGEDVGATSVARYVAATGDARVIAIALTEPIDDPPAWLAQRVPAERLAEQMDEARQAAYEMKSDFMRVDLDVPLGDGRPPLWIMQPPPQFLAWWGPNPRLRLGHVLEEVGVPVRSLASTGAGAVPRESLAAELAAWALEILPRPLGAIHTELVTAHTESDQPLVAYLRTPVAAPRSDPPLRNVHGLTTGPFSPMARQFMCHYADQGFASLAIETRRSGYRAVTESQPSYDEADIDAFVELLVARGWPKVVLVGASQGSQAVSQYVAHRHHPAVAATVHLAPTGESAAYFALGVGRERYEELVAQARAAVATGHPEQLLVTTLQEPPPAGFAPYRRHWWRAGAWLAWWVDIDSHLTLLADVDVPTLLVAGTADDYTDTERMDLVAATLTKASPVTQRWYPADHGLKGVEPQVVADMTDWLQDNGIVERRSRPVDPRPAAEPTPRLGLRHVVSTAGRGL